MEFTSRISQMLALLKKLVELESPSHEKAAVDRVGCLIADECRRLGAQVEILPRDTAGDLVEARFTPSHVSSGSILLLCHMDTVFPLGTLAKMPFYEKDDRIFGPGVSDMKGGIVVAIFALQAILAAGTLSCPVTALFTSDEESGSHASRSRIEELARQSSLVLVLEPGMLDGALKTWRKGVGEYKVTARGRAAHAGGDHSSGRNAIEELAHHVLAIQRLTDYEHGTTLNVGTINGGTVSNVVPDEAVIEVDMRIMEPAEADRIDAAMHSLQPILEGTTIEVSGGLNRPPMPYGAAIRTAYEKVSAIASAAGLALKAGGTGGASDANFVAPLGIPVLDGLGPAGGEYHSEREFVFRESFAERAALLAAVFARWGEMSG